MGRDHAPLDGMLRRWVGRTSALALAVVLAACGGGGSAGGNGISFTGAFTKSTADWNYYLIEVGASAIPLKLWDATIANGVFSMNQFGWLSPGTGQGIKVTYLKDSLTATEYLLVIGNFDSTYNNAPAGSKAADGYCVVAGNGIDACASNGVAFNRASGTLSFTNSRFVTTTGVGLVLNGTLAFQTF